MSLLLAASASAVPIAFCFSGVGGLSMVGRDRVRSHRLTTSRVKTSGVSLLMLLMLTSARAQEVGSGNDEEMQAADSAVFYHGSVRRWMYVRTVKLVTGGSQILISSRASSYRSAGLTDSQL